MEVVRDTGAAFDEKLQDAAPSELVEHGTEITRELERRPDPGSLGNVAEHDPQGLVTRLGRVVAGER